MKKSLILFSSCIGSFNLTNKVLGWNAHYTHGAKTSYIPEGHVT
ncbi:MAG: DUF3332 family protein [Rikenellaceae bacterium]|nr:DUF3332 family protein [Rikenellaceae bacterium]